MIAALPVDPPGDLAHLDRAVWNRLRAQYSGVFDLDRLRAHVADHVEPGEAADLIDLVIGHAPDAWSIVDIGCGYGGFVEVGQRAGVRVVGVDREGVELAFARSRATGAPRLLAADVARLPLAAGCADAVTMWNLLEHVDDPPAVLREARRITRRGGWIFILAPNYAAIRSEAHYHVPWLPLLRGRLAESWLRLLGRDPRLWREEVRPCSARQVRRALADLGLEVRSTAGWKLGTPEKIRSRRLRVIIRVMSRANLLPALAAVERVLARLPLQRSIALAARVP